MPKKTEFVPREIYEIEKKNYKVCYERKQELSKENIKLQQKIKELEAIINSYEQK